MGSPDKIEILTERLIDEHLDLAMEVLAGSARLAIPLGWHYVLDLVWVMRELGVSAAPAAPPENRRVIEIGAGNGLLQFLLADRGFEVTSVDVAHRLGLRRLERCYRFSRAQSETYIEHDYVRHSAGVLRYRAAEAAARALYAARERLTTASRRHSVPPPGPDRRPAVHLYRADAGRMPEVPPASMDVAVSISALEHNPPERIAEIHKEIERVVRPGGLILHTVSAIETGERFHEPSHSFLLDRTQLIRTYELKIDEQPETWPWAQAWQAFQQPRYLDRWLSHIYCAGGNNGMPWGIWRPEYLPVGLARRQRSPGQPAC
ncbi:MAG: class I SAM-dependent methyltransferase [Candidatus Schekmanbacteria bacterium]|nr:class I SAM-dependent methyltransferase [Candidatus Schekmanbacteria bacterium]